MPTPSATPYFRFLSCRTFESMRAQLNAGLSAGETQELVLWEPHNFPARTIDEVLSTWQTLIFHYAVQSLGRPGRPPKKVGYAITLSPGIGPQEMDRLKRAVRRFLNGSFLADAYAVVAYRMSADRLVARIFVHSVLPDLKSWRLPPAEQDAFKNQWLALCREVGMPEPRAAQPKPPEPTPAEGGWLQAPGLEPFVPFEGDDEEDF